MTKAPEPPQFVLGTCAAHPNWGNHTPSPNCHDWKQVGGAAPLEPTHYISETNDKTQVEKTAMFRAGPLYQHHVYCSAIATTKIGEGSCSCETIASQITAPLEPTPLTAKQFEDGDFHMDELNLDWDGYCDVFMFAEAYAAAVSQQLREELAEANERAEKWKRESHRATNGWGKQDANVFTLQARISELEKELTQSQFELADRERQINGLAQDTVRLSELREGTK
jgi:hypothetical protein